MQRMCPIMAFDHIEWYVGNAKQAAYWYQQQFGFAITAYRGLETGDRHTTSYVLEQGNIRFVFTSPLGPDLPMAEHIKRHGDGIAVLAFVVEDAIATYDHAIERGACSAIPPTTMSDRHGCFRYAGIKSYGDIVIKFVEQHCYPAAFAPGFEPYLTLSSLRMHGSDRNGSDPGLVAIDHVVGNVEKGSMAHWVRFFTETLGFETLVHFDDSAITTTDSALMSTVIQDPTGTIKLPINEPAAGRRTSQIDEFLQYNHGPGIQHIALTTTNIIDTVTTLKAAGVEFLHPPQSYYDRLDERVDHQDISIEGIAKLGILADRDQDGYLLQIFTRPLQDRPTLFFEIIERHGATGFGEGNFKTLFEIIEREQQRRGNLV